MRSAKDDLEKWEAMSHSEALMLYLTPGTWEALPYWIKVAEAYRELAEARGEMLRLTQIHRPVAEITACSDRIGEAKKNLEELEGGQ